MKMQAVGIVGAGQMGAGIAQVMAQAGFDVVLCDLLPETLDRARTGIEKSAGRLLQKGKINVSPEEVLRKIKFESNLKALSSVDIAIEAVSENELLKKKVLSQMDEALQLNSLLVSNTSSISITKLASFTGRPEKFMGMHFMNPVPIMPLVELIRGLQTSDETILAVSGLVESLQKTSTLSKDFPGFLANRILMPMINEAFFSLYEGIGSKEDIDTTMKLGCNFPMGPLQLADFIGLDTCLAIMQTLQTGFGDGKYRPCPLLKQYVDAGHLGRKTGQGVYSYQ